MDGFILVDKPVGLSSFDVVRQVRRIARMRKVGHGGTLDPFASGLLVLALGNATRLLEYLLDADKSYRAVMRLGIETDTQDKTGKILERRPVPVIEPGDLDEIFRRFSGTIEQVPPMYSALKKDGVPLYKLARRGQEVGRKPRKVHVRRLEVLHRDGDDICFEVTCSKGTYVRTLAHDIGRALGCGAHLTELRRTGAGPFRVEDAVRCEELAGLSSAGLRKRLLAPLEAMADYRRVPLTELEACRVANGQLPDTIARRLVRQPADGPVCLVTEDRLLAIAHRRGPARENWALQKVFPAS